MNQKEGLEDVRFVRHIQLGPGEIVDREGDNITVRFRNPEGKAEVSPYKQSLKDWRVKSIPEGSLGYWWINSPDKVHSLIEQRDPEIVRLCLKELGGTAKLDQVRRLLEPIVLAGGYDWATWWKKLGQRLRNYSSVTFVKKERTYNITEAKNAGLILLNATEDTVSRYSADSITDLSQWCCNHVTDLKQTDRVLLKAIWVRLRHIQNEMPSSDTRSSAILALGELLSENLPVKEEWLSASQAWLGSEKPNLLAIRDAQIRAYALSAVRGLEWRGKKPTLAFYILHEESGEKNRNTASRFLWEACEKNPKEYFSTLTEETKTLRSPLKNPLAFLPPRMERIVNCTVELIREVGRGQETEDLVAGVSNLISTSYSVFFQVPLNIRPSEEMLGVWFKWKAKSQSTLLPEDRWIYWVNTYPLVIACSEGAVRRFADGGEKRAEWAEEIFKHLIHLANAGRFEKADVLNNLAAILIGMPEHSQRIKAAIDTGVFTSKSSQEWAISHVLKNREVPDSRTSREVGLETVLTELAFHPREREISQRVASLVSIVKENESLLDGVSSQLEELARLYDPSHLETVREFKAFIQLLTTNLEDVRSILCLEFIGEAGSREEYNPEKHQLSQIVDIPPRFVEILYPGVARMQQSRAPEILQKAIVKPAVGGQK